MAVIGYVDLEYANEYVNLHFLSTDDIRFSWEGLRKSFESIESIAFAGRKTCPSQPNAFPRYPSTDVPEDVKAAQVENAVALSDSSVSEDAVFYERLWQFGVESYSIGNLSEKTSSGTWGRGSTAANGVVSAKASRLLQPYISGSFRIRGEYR